MIYDVNTFDDIINLPIRPQAQFYLKAVSNNITGHVGAANVLNSDVDLKSFTIAPNPNDLIPVTLSENGYCVDDPNLRVGNKPSYCNLMFFAGLYNTYPVTRRLFYMIQHPFDETLRMGIKIAPLYRGSFRFDWIEYEIATDSALSTQSITLTATEDYEVLEFDANPTDTSTAYKLMVTALDEDAVDCSIKFDAPEVVGVSEYIITNANLINYSSNEHADLYSQSRSSFEHTVEFLDIDRLYDPQNPQGKYNNLVLGSCYRIYTGYNINGMFVDAYSTEWNTYRPNFYLKDLPVWDNEKVTLHFTDIHTFDSNLTTQVPYIGFNEGVVSKQFAPGLNANREKQVLTSMNYYVRFNVGPYQYADRVDMTIENNAKKLMATTGYLYQDSPIEDVYTLCQNALGCWNYGKDVSDISVDDVRDYTIDKSVIYDEGLFFNKEPLLKTLTVKKYINTVSDTPLTYNVSLQASDFKKWSESDARPYRAELKTDNPLTNIVDVRSITSTNANPWIWGVRYETDSVSGVGRWIIYIFVADPNYGAGTYTATMYPIDTKVEDVSEVVNEEGENLTIDNPFITSDELVTLCATAAKRIAAWREVYDIDVMENFKLRVGDIIKLDTMYETGIPVIITGLQFNIPGPKGHITCRRIG